MIRVLVAVGVLAAMSLAGLYGLGWWMRATGRTELTDDARARRDDVEQRRWADFATVMDRHTRSPK